MATEDCSTYRRLHYLYTNVISSLLVHVGVARTGSDYVTKALHKFKVLTDTVSAYLVAFYEPIL